VRVRRIAGQRRSGRRERDATGSLHPASAQRASVRVVVSAGEVADLPNGGRGVRDSKNPTGPALMFTTAERVAFTAGVRAGEFD
jgi:uncharacterized protein DUF397